MLGEPTIPRTGSVELSIFRSSYPGNAVLLGKGGCKALRAGVVAVPNPAVVGEPRMYPINPPNASNAAPSNVLVKVLLSMSAGNAPRNSYVPSFGIASDRKENSRNRLTAPRSRTSSSNEIRYTAKSVPRSLYSRPQEHRRYALALAAFASSPSCYDPSKDQAEWQARLLPQPPLKSGWRQLAR